MATFCRYGGFEVFDARRLRQREDEKGMFKRMPVDSMSACNPEGFAGKGPTTLASGASRCRLVGFVVRASCRVASLGNRD